MSLTLGTNFKNDEETRRIYKLFNQHKAEVLQKKLLNSVEEFSRRIIKFKTFKKRNLILFHFLFFVTIDFFYLKL